MNYRSTYILFGLLAVVLVLLAVALIRSPEVEPSKFVLPILHDKTSPVAEADIDRIEIERGSDKINLARQSGGAWKVNDLRASGLAVNQLLHQIFTVQREPVDKPDKPADWDLVPPAETVKLFRADNSQVAELRVGKTGAGNLLYVLDASRPDDPMAVRKTSLDAVLNSITAFRDRTLLGPPAGITRIELSESGIDRKLALEETSGTWRFISPSPFTGLASSDGPDRRSPKGAPSSVPALEHDIGELQPGAPETSPQDFVANNVPPVEWVKYHLDPAKNKILSIKVNRQGDTPRELLIGLDKPADDKGDSYFARLANEPNVVRVPAREVKALTTLLEAPEVLRDYHLVRLATGEVIDALKIELLDQEKPVVLEFYRPVPGVHADAAMPGNWQFYIGDQAQGLDRSYLEGLIELLKQDDMINSFPPDDKGSGLDKPKVVVSVYHGSDIKALPGQKPTLDPNARPIILRFAALDKPYSWASREQNGEKPTFLRVKDVLRERIGEGPLAYRSKDLIPYKTDPKAFESKLIIHRDGKDITLARPAADKPWAFTDPSAATNKVNTPTVDRILRFLLMLRAARMEREKPDAKTLAEWGFTDNPDIIKATVTVTGSDGKTSDHTYEFAKDKNADLVYARQSDRPDLIFSVAKPDIGFLKLELRDPTIFAFDPSKATVVNLVVGNKSHTPVNLKLQGSNWIDAGNAKNKVDEEKLRKLLAQLGSLQAQSFVPGPADPAKYGLRDEDNPLDITVKVEGQVKPYILRIGKSEGGDVFATSNRVPEDEKQPREVFKLTKFPFVGAEDDKPSLKKDPDYLYQ